MWDLKKKAKLEWRGSLWLMGIEPAGRFQSAAE